MKNILLIILLVLTTTSTWAHPITPKYQSATPSFDTYYSKALKNAETKYTPAVTSQKMLHEKQQEYVQTEALSNAVTAYNQAASQHKGYQRPLWGQALVDKYKNQESSIKTSTTKPEKTKPVAQPYVDEAEKEFDAANAYVAKPLKEPLTKDQLDQMEKQQKERVADSTRAYNKTMSEWKERADKRKGMNKALGIDNTLLPTSSILLSK